MSATQFAALAARTTEPHVMLRRFLALDALVTGVNAVAYLAASGPLARFLGVGWGCCSNSACFSPCTPPPSAGWPRAGSPPHCRCGS